mmetsp:Transcript_75350/g.243700  ORF Transcript_75350/g.243700 Transcript_75350/m.243700 type:complete len:251 (-) Transcript_75350:436-1188(-)
MRRTVPPHSGVVGRSTALRGRTGHIQPGALALHRVAHSYMAAVVPWEALAFSRVARRLMAAEVLWEAPAFRSTPHPITARPRSGVGPAHRTAACPALGVLSHRGAQRMVLCRHKRGARHTAAARRMRACPRAAPLCSRVLRRLGTVHRMLRHTALSQRRMVRHSSGVRPCHTLERLEAALRREGLACRTLLLHSLPAAVLLAVAGRLSALRTTEAPAVLHLTALLCRTVGPRRLPVLHLMAALLRAAVGL